MASEGKAQIVIAGGGFGGLYAAHALERALPADRAEVHVVSDTNYMLYTPLLPGAAAGTLEPRHVVIPLREELRRASLLVGTVVGLEPEHSVLHVNTEAGHRREIAYDQLVLALGSVSRVAPVPGLAEHAIGFKTIAEAIYLRNHVIDQLEKAEACGDPEERRAHLGFVFVGAGYAGVEAIAELNDFVSELIELYPRCSKEQMRWMLVEQAGTVLPEIGSSLAEFGSRELRKRGIHVHTKTSLASCTATSATLSTGETVAAHTLVWTAGVVASPGSQRLGLPDDGQGRIAVSAELRSQAWPNIWAIGDAAAVPDPAQPGKLCPPTAQHAIRQGRSVARNIAATLGVGTARPFRYKTRGCFVDMGRHQAAVSIFGLKFRGFPAWWMARSYHLLLMPGLKRKLRLVTDWTVGLFFGRDASELGEIGHPPKLS